MVAACALLLAQHFGVVDFLDLEARTAGRVPQVRDAAVGADVFRRSGEQQQERAPGVGVRPGVDGQRANHVAIQDLGELGDGRIGLGPPARRRARSASARTWSVNGPLSVRREGGLRQPAERRADGRVTAGVQRHRARRRFARRARTRRTGPRPRAQASAV